MIKNILFFFLCSFSAISFSQDIIEETVVFEKDTIQTEILLDTISYQKDLLFEEKKTFKSNLREKYSGKDFTYTDIVEKPPEKVSPPIDTGFIKGFIFFMKTIFPYLLGIVVIFIILKVFLGVQMGSFFNFKNSSKKGTKKLVYEEDEDIHETDFKRLLEKAIADKNYRLATRYYYLSLLKKLSDKKEIEFHKDKTNTEYLFEIENKQIRTQFSDVSYIYSYVWYGEFPLDAAKFKTVEKKYKSIFKTIH